MLGFRVLGFRVLGFRFLGFRVLLGQGSSSHRRSQNLYYKNCYPNSTLNPKPLKYLIPGYLKPVAFTIFKTEGF